MPVAVVVNTRAAVIAFPSVAEPAEETVKGFLVINLTTLGVTDETTDSTLTIALLIVANPVVATANGLPTCFATRLRPVLEVTKTRDAVIALDNTGLPVAL